MPAGLLDKAAWEAMHCKGVRRFVLSTGTCTHPTASRQLPPSVATATGRTLTQVDSRLDKRKKGVYGPPMGKRCVVFVDDLNMPAKEK